MIFNSDIQLSVYFCKHVVFGVDVKVVIILFSVGDCFVVYIRSEIETNKGYHLSVFSAGQASSVSWRVIYRQRNVRLLDHETAGMLLETKWQGSGPFGQPCRLNPHLAGHVPQDLGHAD